MKFGRMNRKIIIQVPTETQDAIGANVQSWATFATLWAEVKESNGFEWFKGNREVATQQVKFICWYISGITTKMRISYNNKYYDIALIKEIGLREGLEIIAEVLDG